MHFTNKKNILFFIFFGTSITLFAQKNKEPQNIRTLIVFFDGLRPDYITQESMPNLYAFSKRGCYGQNHHSVFPTVTRVNSSSYATGSYPATNGLMGNTVYFPEVDKKKGLNTGEASEMNKISAATNGHLLTTISLGEILAKEGKKMMVFSSGSSGQALFQNHTVSGGAIINTSMILPENLKPIVEKDLGTIPPHSKPNIQQHKWITDALMKYAITLDGPLVSAIWFSDPDGTAHYDGIGAASSMISIKSVDEQFGRIISDISSKGLNEIFNIIISTDHGFVTNIGKIGLAEFLIKEGLKKDKESEDVIVSEGAVYVQNHDEEKIKLIIQKLQAQNWIGGIYTKAKVPGDLKGWVDGTLSFDAIHWNHPIRSGDILIDYNWNDDKNQYGYAGTSFSRGVAGHGGFSKYEVHIALLADGPSFKKSFLSDLPTSNVDIAPTVFKLHNISIPTSMDGRVMEELFINSKLVKKKIRTEIITTSSKLENSIEYILSIQRSIIGKYKYVDFSKVQRNIINN